MYGRMLINNGVIIYDNIIFNYNIITFLNFYMYS